MKKADLLIAHNKDAYDIKVGGRANFEYGLPLRNFAKSLDNQKFSKVSIDLEDCNGMDSTFMGILTMIALKSKKCHADVEIINASDANRALLHSLGIAKLFSFIDRNEEDVDEDWQSPENQEDALSTAETVIEAHKTLMEVDDENIPRFEQVVEYAEQDAERLKKEKR